MYRILNDTFRAMSSASSAVTYTSVYTDSELGRVFWGADEELSDDGPPRVIVYGYDRLPMQPPRDHDYMPEPIYPEYIPLEDEHVFLVEEQPLPPFDSPTAESPGYLAKSDPEEDPEEYEDDETKDGPVNYPMDGGDDGDDDNSDSSVDDADDEDEDEEEEEHLALVDSAVIVPTVEPASISLPPEAEVERLLAIPTPLPSPPISLSPPSARESLARIASTQALIDAVTAALPSPPLPPLLPSLYIPPHVDCRDDHLESELPPCKRLHLSTLGPKYEIGESSTARSIRDLAEAVPEIAPMTLREVNTMVTKLAELHEHDTQDLYALLKDAQEAHQETILIVEEEAYASREAWAHTIGLSQAVHYELQTHPEQVHETRFQMQQAEMAAFQDTDHRRQAQMAKTLRVMKDMRREMGDMQAELLALRGQRRRAR
ncbi:hypothetical protein Tco_1050079 [Tanacetum coccineum]